MDIDELRAFVLARIAEDEHLDDYHEKQPTLRHYRKSDDEAMLRWEAARFADHPDFRPEWAEVRA